MEEGEEGNGGGEDGRKEGEKKIRKRKVRDREEMEEEELDGEGRRKWIRSRRWREEERRK